MPKGLPEPERPDADVCVQRFLKEFETDYIDLVQIHCMTSAEVARGDAQADGHHGGAEAARADPRPRRVDPFARGLGGARPTSRGST